MDHSPQNKTQSNAMPHTAHKKYDDRVDMLSDYAFSVSSKRDVDVIPEEIA